MVAWAEWMLNGGLTYNYLEWVLEVAAHSGRITPGEGKRPLPHEVIIDAEFIAMYLVTRRKIIPAWSSRRRIAEYMRHSST
ncbi:hypothetical protein KSD_59750 [Ktedonobacter sp. SOSP1-85]|uniref:hypothetical protein n=1 Tax=Ktedonobacter sp. SOSP1-85 TaxID=2778367 RepID=UPI001916109B|nr:hypothetical protein [Ktedonobacter sp. SOSP1-85]GHO78204.1 hypothetical protein KSD_59750 [Ktedonobacter sp. SOSP1-85]